MNRLTEVKRIATVVVEKSKKDGMVELYTKGFSSYLRATVQKDDVVSKVNYWQTLYGNSRIIATDENGTYHVPVTTNFQIEWRI